MSKSVLETVNEGIKSVGLDEVDEQYIWILNDFYKGLCVIDPIKHEVPKSGKYGKSYYCFDGKRNKSSLEVVITEKEVIKITHTSDKSQKIAVLNNVEFEALKSKVEKRQVLKLESITYLDEGSKKVDLRVVAIAAPIMGKVARFDIFDTDGASIKGEGTDYAYDVDKERLTELKFVFGDESKIATDVIVESELEPGAAMKKIYDSFKRK